MYYRATILAAAATWTMSLSAQTPPPRLEQMPVLRPGADYFNRVPLVQPPAPPCDEEER
jgi:hypothetical protein